MVTKVRSHRHTSAQSPAQGLRPVSGHDPRVLILGSFPSQRSLAGNEYYGNPRNQFWKIMESLFSIDHQLPYAIRCSLLNGHGIALWDVVASCNRPGSADSRIREPVFNDLAGFLVSHPSLRLVALNGAAAGSYFLKSRALPTLPSVILPSTSPANARSSLPEKVRQWEIIRSVCSGDQEKKGMKLPFHPEFQEDDVVDCIESHEYRCSVPENRDPANLFWQGEGK
jgi:TDG/mug DNA glycosylase family protein